MLDTVIVRKCERKKFLFKEKQEKDLAPAELIKAPYDPWVMKGGSLRYCQKQGSVISYHLQV